MIVFENSRIEYGDEITPKKIDGFLILYATPSKGKIQSYLMACNKIVNTVPDELDEEGNVVTPGREEVFYNPLYSLETASKVFDDTQFAGNILEALHAIYIPELQSFNPTVTFTNTL